MKKLLLICLFLIVLVSCATTHTEYVKVPGDPYPVIVHTPCIDASKLPKDVTPPIMLVDPAASNWGVILRAYLDTIILLQHQIDVYKAAIEPCIVENPLSSDTP